MHLKDVVVHASRKKSTGVPFAVSVLILAVTDHAEAPKLSAETTLVPRGNTDRHSKVIVSFFVSLDD